MIDRERDKFARLVSHAERYIVASIMMMLRLTRFFFSLANSTYIVDDSRWHLLRSSILKAAHWPRVCEWAEVLLVLFQAHQLLMKSRRIDYANWWSERWSRLTPFHRKAAIHIAWPTTLCKWCGWLRGTGTCAICIENLCHENWPQKPIVCQLAIWRHYFKRLKVCGYLRVVPSFESIAAQVHILFPWHLAADDLSFNRSVRNLGELWLWLALDSWNSINILMLTFDVIRQMWIWLARAMPFAEMHEAYFAWLLPLLCSQIEAAHACKSNISSGAFD